MLLLKLFYPILPKIYALNILVIMVNLFLIVANPLSLKYHDLVINKDLSLFGKAYIISTLPIGNNDVYNAALACGFYPTTISAIQPIKDIYNNSIDMFYKKCFSNINEKEDLVPFKTSKAYGLSLGEMALICSHRKVYNMITKDQSISNDDWSLILEDDAILNPFFNSSNFGERNLTMLIKESLDQFRPGAEGLVYLGSCFPEYGFEDCKMGKYKQRCTQIFGQQCHSTNSYISIKCISLCSHAYVIRKSLAKTWFSRLYNSQTLLQRPDEDSFLQREMPTRLPIDWAMLDMFKDSRKFDSFFAAIVGLGFAETGKDSHAAETGVLLQYRNKTNYNTSGVFLKDRFMDDFPCFTLILDSRINHRISHFMFSYAFLLGLCTRARGNPGYCVNFIIGDGEHSKQVTNLASLALCSRTNRSCLRNNKTVVVVGEEGYEFAFSQPIGTTFAVRDRLSPQFFHPFADLVVRERVASLLSRDRDKNNQTKKNLVSNARSHRSEDVCILVDWSDLKANASAQLVSQYNDFHFAALGRFTQLLGSVDLTVLSLRSKDMGLRQTEQTGWRHWTKNIETMEGISRFSTIPLKSESEAILKFSTCRNIIVSPSCLSCWWGAYLSDPRSVVVMPKKFSNSANEKLNEFVMNTWETL